MTYRSHFVQPPRSRKCLRGSASTPHRRGAPVAPAARQQPYYRRSIDRIVPVPMSCSPATARLRAGGRRGQHRTCHRHLEAKALVRDSDSWHVHRGWTCCPSEHRLLVYYDRSPLVLRSMCPCHNRGGPSTAEMSRRSGSASPAARAGRAAYCRCTSSDQQRRLATSP